MTGSCRSSFSVGLRRPGGRWWAPFLAGAAAGLAAGVVLGGRREGLSGNAPSPEPRDGAGHEGEGPGWRERAWAGAVRSLEQARERLKSTTPVDLEALTRRLSALPCGERVRVRDLGEGIVEVVGAAPDEATARALLDAAGGAPGVEVVVNRVWTPSSGVHNVPGL